MKNITNASSAPNGAILEELLAKQNNNLVVGMLPTSPRTPQRSSFSRKAVPGIMALLRNAKVPEDTKLFERVKTLFTNNKFQGFFSTTKNPNDPNKILLSKISAKTEDLAETPVLTAPELFSQLEQFDGNPLKTNFVIVNMDSKQLISSDLVNQEQTASENFIKNLVVYVKHILSLSDEPWILQQYNLLEYFCQNFERAHIFPLTVGNSLNLRVGGNDNSTTLYLPKALHNAIDKLANWYLNTANPNQNLVELLKEKKQRIVDLILNFNEPIEGLKADVHSQQYQLYLAITALRYQTLADQEIMDIQKLFKGKLENLSLDVFLAARVTNILSDGVTDAKRECLKIDGLVKSWRDT